jgi:hypothetical protein
MSSARYEARPDGRSTKSPFTLTERAEGLHESLTQARRDEATIENDWRDGVVAFSRTRGIVIATLLRELSARVTPGTVVGRMRSDDAMADLAAELATDLHSARVATEYGD